MILLMGLSLYAYLTLLASVRLQRILLLSGAEEVRYLRAPSGRIRCPLLWRWVRLGAFRIAGSGRLGRLQRAGACFAVCPEYVINVALRGGRDAPFKYSVERQRESSSADRRHNARQNGRKKRPSIARAARRD